MGYLKRNWLGDDGSAVGTESTSQFAIVAGMAVHRGPISGIVASPDGDRLLLSNYRDHSVSIIDTGTWAGVRTITGINEPFTIAMSPADPATLTSARFHRHTTRSRSLTWRPTASSPRIRWP
ncbi:hypothetical protein I553_4135 [Mycobacterium xenopi 4042]|uniref:Lactonase, 7-bladed beta-propeller family protein n=1 Tax=Mycobacterium xenopi 4042 TaxID=1299334 RepID=X8AD67_MYCXE|nr:hypothetical protein I553_4135 [Mycobacterium xenopi 4042]EUA50571.1 hypothetical protein I552_1507 [Mycobacterium xenopi 3993]